MCDMCGNTEGMDALIAALLVQCERIGWSPTFVAGGGDGTMPYGYTCGRASRDLNELVVVGVNPHQTAEILEAFVQAEKCGDVVLEPGQVQLPGSRFGVWLIDVDEDPRRYPLDIAHLIADRQTGRASMHALQIVAPDLEGHYPWETDCDPTWGAGQPILGRIPKEFRS